MLTYVASSRLSLADHLNTYFAENFLRLALYVVYKDKVLLALGVPAHVVRECDSEGLGQHVVIRRVLKQSSAQSFQVATDNVVHRVIVDDPLAYSLEWFLPAWELPDECRPLGGAVGDDSLEREGELAVHGLFRQEGLAIVIVASE